MVRVLIFAATDNTVTKYPYHTGDIVAVKPDTWVWGSLERLPTFLRVDVSDMSWFEAETLTDSVFDSGGKLLEKRKFFCSQNIKPENQDRFAQCLATDQVYVTEKSEFILQALQER